MKIQIDNLGKVAVTIEEDYWDIKKPYDKLTIVERAGTGTTFISRKPVPAGTSILNRNYWIKFSKWSDIPYEITQKFGDSDELAISQKTLTNKFSEVETEIQEGDEALDQRLRVVEVHERIMVDGGELEVATAEDLENPQTPRQEAAVPTVRAILDASDDEPHLNSTKRFINSDNLAKMYGYYLDNPEFIYVLADDEYRIILGVKTDGDVVFGVTVPSQIKEYIDSRINEILGVDDITEKIDTINEMIAFFDEISHDTTLKELLAASAQAVAEEKTRAEAVEHHLDEVKANKEEVNATLDTKVDKEEGKSLIDVEYASTKSTVDNPEFLDVTTDAEGKVLEGIQKDGTKVIGGDLRVGGSASVGGDFKVLGNMEIEGLTYQIIENHEYLAAWVDAEDKVIFGFKTDGKTYIGDASFLNEIKNNQEAINEIKSYLANLDIDALSSITAVENPEYIDVKVDSEDKILEGITTDGIKKINIPVDTPSATVEHIENPEWLSVTTDLKGKLLEGINNNGEKVFGKIPPQIKELIGCGKLIIAASNSKYKQFANVICAGEHDQDVINECINKPDVKSIYFLDGTYLIDAPILPKSGLYIEAHNDSLFTTIDMVEATLTEEVSIGNVLKLSSVDGFHPGMLLYIADDSGSFDSGKSWIVAPKITSINKDNNTITVSSNVPRTFPIGTVVKSASPCFLIDHISNVTINGVNIDWNVANNPRQKYNPWYLQEGIQIAYSEYVTVKNCKINNGGRRGICTTDSKYYQIINNYFDNWHEHSIDLYWDYYIPFDGYENLNPPMAFGVVSGNICLNNQMSGIQCHRGSGCTIIGNTIKNCPHGGIRNQEYAHHNAIVGNVIEGCGAGLFLGGHDITANGNVIKDCNIGVQIGEFSDRVIVDGNSIQNSQNSAVIFSSARFCRVANNIITNSCLAITASSSSDVDVSVVSITRIESSVYDTTNHHNQVIGNTFIEESRELLPKYIFKNPEDNTKNVVVRNLCIIDGTIETPFDYTTSDVVKDNDIIN